MRGRSRKHVLLGGRDGGIVLVRIGLDIDGTDDRLDGERRHRRHRHRRHRHRRHGRGRTDLLTGDES